MDCVLVLDRDRRPGEPVFEVVSWSAWRDSAMVRSRSYGERPRQGLQVHREGPGTHYPSIVPPRWADIAQGDREVLEAVIPHCLAYLDSLDGGMELDQAITWLRREVATVLGYGFERAR